MVGELGVPGELTATQGSAGADERLWERLTTLVDADLERALSEPPEIVAERTGHRGVMVLIKTAVAGFLNPGSRFTGRSGAIAPIGAWLERLTALQDDQGLFTSGDNLVSPPDSGFTVNDIGLVHRLITEATPAARTELAWVATALEGLLRRSRDPLTAGGIHTPNHRWEIASALARIDRVLPDAAVRARIDTWLAEGIDIATDGLYSERSPNYAAHVSNPSLLVLAEHLERPDLRELVHRSLHAQVALTDVDGRVETVHSRRQDQKSTFDVSPFLMQLRRFALADGCAVCSRTAGLALDLLEHEAVTPLAELLIEPGLGQSLSPSATDVEDGVVTFESADLVRLRRGSRVLTVYGGSDVPATGRVASGLACNPTFLRWRSGAAVLDSIRLSRTFFGLGPFRSEGLVVDGDTFRLCESVSAAYYQPLPTDHRSADGVYVLEHEGRFAAAMDFSARAQDRVRLTTAIDVTVGDGAVRIDSRFEGVACAYAFELVFRPGGVLSGVRPLAGTDCYELVEGYGSYRVGDDVITFGPGGGSGPAQPPTYDPGEAYTFLGGTDACAGIRVYVTGRTPGATTLDLTASDG